MAADVSGQESAFMREKQCPSVVLQKYPQVPQHSGIQMERQLQQVTSGKDDVSLVKLEAWLGCIPIDNPDRHE
jgi:hypothetical protein